MPIMSVSEIKFDDSPDVFGKDAPTFDKIRMAESSGNPKAINKNKNGTFDSGLYQINSVHIPELQKQGIIKTSNDLFDPEVNTKAAAYLYQRDGLKPWGASKDKWSSNVVPIDKIVFDEEKKVVLPETAKKEPSMLGNMADDLSKRVNNMKDIYQYTQSPETVGTLRGLANAPGAALMQSSQIIGGAGDVIGDAIGAIMPDYVKDKFNNAVKNIVESKSGSSAIEYLKGFQEDNPITSKMAGDMFNVASILPIGKGAQAVAGPIVSKAAGTTAEVIEKNIFKNIVNYVKKDVTKMGKEGIEARAAGKVESGRFKNIALKETPQDIESAKAVADVINPKGNVDKNIANIYDKISKRAYEIDNIVLDKEANSIKIRTGAEDDLMSYFNKAKSESDVVFGKDKTVEDTYDSVIELFQKERAKQPNTLTGIYKARQNMDREIRSKFGADVLEKDAKDISRKAAMQDIHKAVGDFISDTLPEGNQFKALLRDESNMYRATRNIAFNNAPTVSKTLLGKISHFAHEHPFVIGGAMGGAGFGASMLAGITASPLIMGSLALYGGYKVGKTIVTSQMVKQGLAKTLRSMESVLSPIEKAEIKNVILRMDSSEKYIHGRKAIGPGKPSEGSTLYGTEGAVKTTPEGDILLERLNQANQRVTETGQSMPRPNLRKGPMGEPRSYVGPENYPIGRQNLVPVGLPRQIFPSPEADFIANPGILSIANRRIDPAQSVRKPRLTPEQLAEIVRRMQGQ